MYKRAQILTADLYSAFIELDPPIVLKNASELTMFADYRVPQILREIGIFEYAHSLEESIDNKKEIAANSEEEIEIRANTIIAVEKIKNEMLTQFKKNVLSIEVDYVLWNEGESLRKTIKPHHRTLTIFY